MEYTTATLKQLRTEFLETSTQSMPIAGMVFWAVIAISSFYVAPIQVSYMVGFGSGMIFPFAILLDRILYRRIAKSSSRNPVTQSFLTSLALVVLLWPFMIIAATQAHQPNLVVLGGAILMGVIWIPYGWAADDPVGLQHAIGRCVLSYAAYIAVPEVYKVPAIATAVLICYAYSFIRMRKAEIPSRALGAESIPGVHR